MKTIKMFVLIFALATFMISCSSSAPSNMVNTGVNRVVTNTAVRNTNTSHVGTNTTPSSNATVRLKPDVAAVAADDELVENDLGGLYKENCMVCHKDTGKGGKITIEGKSINPIDLTSARTKAKSDDKLLAEIKEGVPDEGMPGFSGKLTDEQIKSIIIYFRTLK